MGLTIEWRLELCKFAEMGFWREGERDLPGFGIGNPRLSFCSEFTWGKREEASFSLPLGIGEFALPVFCFLCFHFSFLFSEATVFFFFLGFVFYFLFFLVSLGRDVVSLLALSIWRCERENLVKKMKMRMWQYAYFIFLTVWVRLFDFLLPRALVTVELTI